MMLAVENYHKEYYKKNKKKSKANFKKWYSKPENKEKMKIHMRNYMRKKKNIKEEDYRVNGEHKEKPETKTKLHDTIIHKNKQIKNTEYNTEYKDSEYIIRRKRDTKTSLHEKLKLKEDMIGDMAKENIRLIEELIVMKKYLKSGRVQLPNQ